MLPYQKKLWHDMHRQQRHTNMCKLRTLQEEGVNIRLRRGVSLSQQACSVVVEVDGYEWLNIAMYRVSRGEFNINEHYFAVKSAANRALHYALYKLPSFSQEERGQLSEQSKKNQQRTPTNRANGLRMVETRNTSRRLLQRCGQQVRAIFSAQR